MKTCLPTDKPINMSIKKFTLLFGLYVSIYTQAQSQNKFGLKAGLNIANLQINDPFTEYKSRASYHLGGFAHFYLNKYVAIQPELLFSGQGTRVRLDHGDDVVPRYGIAEWKLNYVNFPVMVQYLLKNGFRFETGPQVGLLISAKSKYYLDVYNMKNDFKDLDFSLGMGASYLTKTGLGFGIRYNLGLADISEISSPETKNRVFQFSLFYEFKK